MKDNAGIDHGLARCKLTIFGDAEEDHDSFVRQDCRCQGRYTNCGPPIQKNSVSVLSLSLPLVDNEFGRDRDGI